MSTPQYNKKESPIQEIHPPKAPLPTTSLRNEISFLIDGNIDFDSYENLKNALQKLGGRNGYSLIIQQWNKGKKGSTILIDCDKERLNKVLWL